MEYLTDDPTYLATGLGLMALGFLVALWRTQQGRYLVWALTALGLATVLLVVEHFWITDSERIERVVHGLRDAVAAGDAEKTLSYMTPDVQYTREGEALSGEATRVYLRTVVPAVKFDVLRISQLRPRRIPSRAGAPPSSGSRRRQHESADHRL